MSNRNLAAIVKEVDLAILVGDVDGLVEARNRVPDGTAVRHRLLGLFREGEHTVRQIAASR